MKGLVLNSLSYCVKEKKPCVGWINKYFKDCLCNPRDEFSFALGIASLLCWGVAEIPQIVTNFRTKSSHGISLLFLFTWVAGSVSILLPFLYFLIFLLYNKKQLYQIVHYTSRIKDMVEFL